MYRTTDHPATRRASCTPIAAVYQSMGDHDRAIVTYEQALAVNEPLGRCDIDAMVLGNLARLLGRRGRVRRGDRASASRRSTTAREHAPMLVGSVLADLAEAYVGIADEANAVGCFATRA